MTESLIIPCAHCAGLNRIPADRLAERPRCGRCKSSVLTDKPFDVNQASFANQIKGDVPLLVDVWASWCGPCRSFAPTFAQAATQLQVVAGWPNWTARPIPSCRLSWAFARFRA